MTYVIAAQWRARNGEADKIAQLLPELVRACKAEPGVIAFIAHRSPDDPDEFFLYEQYRDEAAFKTHQATPHFKRLVLEGAVPLLEKRIRMPLRILA